LLWGIRMKTNEEKLAIYRAYLEGKEIEIKYAGGPWVAPNGKPSFDYSQYDYRIKPDRIKVRTMTVAKAYVMPEGYIFWTLTEPAYPYKEATRAPEFDLVANP